MRLNEPYTFPRVDSPATKHRWSKRFELVRRAKSRLDESLSNVIHFQMTHAEMLTEMSKVYQEQWFKQLPGYMRAECHGYEDSLIYSRHSAYQLALTNAHLYQGVLYRDFNDWRVAFPNADASDLTDSCCSVWHASGKVHSHYQGRVASECCGKQYPWSNLTTN